MTQLEIEQLAKDCLAKGPRKTYDASGNQVVAYLIHLESFKTYLQIDEWLVRGQKKAKLAFLESEIAAALEGLES